MMTELLLCPFCGNTPTVFEEDKDNWVCVCDARNGGCGAASGVRRNFSEAIAAWNTRYQPTCTMEANKYGDIFCSNCGTEMDFYELGCGLGEKYYDHPFCFQCGAKVVDE